MIYQTFQTKGLFTRAKKKWNGPDKKCNGSEHGPQKTEKWAKLFTHCIFDNGTDRASEKKKTEAENSRGSRASKKLHRFLIFVPGMASTITTQLCHHLILTLTCLTITTQFTIQLYHHLILTSTGLDYHEAIN